MRVKSAAEAMEEAARKGSSSRIMGECGVDGERCKGEEVRVGLGILLAKRGRKRWDGMTPMVCLSSRSELLEIRQVLVLGGGSAGLLAALTLKRMRPELEVKLVASAEIGVIGVGEGTTAVFPDHLFRTLGISPAEFYEEARPTWKQGIRFVWGPREDFFYDFEFQYDRQYEGTARPVGYYATEDCRDLSQTSALMQRDRVFLSGPLGRPLMKPGHAFHIENKLLVRCLESVARRSGVIFEEDTLERVEVEGKRVSALHFREGGERRADLYVDASGFRAELIGKALGEPFKSFSGGLFCDRAVIGGWERTDEVIHPYTTAETMDSGWCWQIEHEHFINRGYVYGGSFLSDEEALEEFLRVNPKVSTEPRVVKFRSGRYERNWVGNVVAIGNASGFVEPLEATALAQIIYESRWLAEMLRVSEGRPDEVQRQFYNRLIGVTWDEIRDFLAFHYKFNRRRDTAFWRHCHEETSLGDYEGFYRLYEEVGPSPGLLVKAVPQRPNIYGVEGFLAMLVGMRVPHRAMGWQPAAEDLAKWERQRQKHAGAAASGLTVKEALRAIRSPQWRWGS